MKTTWAWDPVIVARRLEKLRAQLKNDSTLTAAKRYALVKTIERWEQRYADIAKLAGDYSGAGLKNDPSYYRY